MLLSEYIKVLQEFSSKNADLCVEITQSGYYAQGYYAELFDVPQINEGDGSKGYICLGHSHQSY